MVYEYLSFQAVEHSSETFFSDIYNLLPGHNLTIDLLKPRLTTYCYYNPRFTIDHAITLEESAEEFHRLLKDSVRLRLRSDVNVGSCLSGGLDSSAIVCLINDMLQKSGQSELQHTFSSHFENEEANELEFMEEVIKATNVNAHFTYPTHEGLLTELEQLVWHQEEPFGSTSIYAQWSVFKLAKQHNITVMLDGQGADELLAGYVPYSSNYYLQELVIKRKLLMAAFEAWRFKAPPADFLRPILKRILPEVMQQLILILKKIPMLYHTLKTLKPQKQYNLSNEDWLKHDLSKKYLEEKHLCD